MIRKSKSSFCNLNWVKLDLNFANAKFSNIHFEKNMIVLINHETLEFCVQEEVEYANKL